MRSRTCSYARLYISKRLRAFLLVVTTSTLPKITAVQAVGTVVHPKLQGESVPDSGKFLSWSEKHITFRTTLLHPTLYLPSAQKNKK